MSHDRLFDEVKDEANRPDPYPLYARLRETPVSLQHDGTYVASTHATIARLLGDPRVSSETLPPAIHPHTGNPVKDWIVNPLRNWITNRHRPFIFRDPPDHDALRSAVMHEFTADRVWKMRRRSQEIVDRLLAKVEARPKFDVVADLAYPLPVTVICELLGVPAEDESKFSGWSTQLASALEPDSLDDRQNREKNAGAFDEIADYMKALIAKKRKEPADDILSGLAAKSAPETEGVSDYDVISTAILLLIAGHETTVNLIANGTLALTRHPDELARLIADPSRGARVVEEVMRFDAPVQFRTRKTLADVEIEGVTIPEGASLALLLASGNRDPSAYREPDRFDPDRTDNRHLGFGGSLHYCVGAPLARFEAEIALTSLARLLKDRRPVADPPPYRPGASLRGPSSLVFAR